MKEVIRELRIQYPEWSEHQWIDFCKELVGRGIFECQIVAFEMIGRDKKLLNALGYNFDLTDITARPRLETTVADESKTSRRSRATEQRI